MTFFISTDLITNDYILINRLEPSKSGIGDEGEELDISPRVKWELVMNMPFLPTCIAVFSNRRDEVKVEEAFKELIDKNAERKESFK